MNISKKYSKNEQLFGAIVAKQLTLLGLKKPDLALRIGISRSSLYNKLNKPGTFTLSELRNLHQVLKFTEAERHLLID